MMLSFSRKGAAIAISRNKTMITIEAIETLSRRSRDRAICHGERPRILLTSSGATAGASASSCPALMVIPDGLPFGSYNSVGGKQ
jgi:hypothetical protein